MKLIKHLAKGIVVFALAAYVMLFLATLIFQRSFIFVPPPLLGKHTPADLNIPFDSVRIPLPSGETISAWWIPQPDQASVHPTVVYCHGNGATISMFTDVSSIFYSLGWNALIFDYRGYGASDEATDGLSEVSVDADADAAYRWVTARVPEGSTIVWGHSLGSSIAAKVASLHKPAGLILEGAFPSMLDMARERYPYFPIASFMVLDKFDTASYIKSHTYPILMLHAELDTIIPIQFGRTLASETPPPVTFLPIPGINHNGFPSVHQLYDKQIKSTVEEWTKGAQMRSAGK